MKKIKLAVLMGGRTAEHEISLKSGQMILANLNPQKYAAFPIIITKKGAWILKGKKLTIGEALNKLKEMKTDLVFIAMHGPYGEDGTIQGLFEIVGIPYTGSDVASSAIAMDKIIYKELVAQHQILVPPHLVLTETEWKKFPARALKKIAKKIKFPCVAKVPRLGSSVGMGIAKNKAQLKKIISQIIKYDHTMMIEKFIKGREITSSVFGGFWEEKPRALPITEIVPKISSYFDYRAKYTTGGTLEITPARISKKLTQQAQRIAVTIHKEIGCGDLSRTDMIIKGKKIYVLETNTIPGMTTTSLFPQAALAAGINFSTMLDRIIYLALDRFKRKKIYCEKR